MGFIANNLKEQQELTDLELILKDDNTHWDIQRNHKMLAPEWFPQSGVQLTWPHENTDWADMLEEVTACYLRLAYEIALREPLIIVCPNIEAVKTLIDEQLPQSAKDNIRYFACPTNDTWARDHAFLTVIDTAGIQLLDYRFNGWGGKFEATYDNAINRRLYEAGVVKGNYTSRLDFELEGGSIESDGKGTLLTTAECLLNPNRNPQYDKAQIESILAEDFGIDHFLWLEHGALAGDDTDSHVDTLARLCPNDTIVYVQCQRPTDKHYEDLRLMEAELQAFRTREGEPFRLIPVPLPEAIYDEDGERLPATYANYLVMNRTVLFPTYAQPEGDEMAKRALQQAFPGYDIVGVDCRALIRQHGSLHCATMQYPRGVVPEKESV
ncbi:peptidyl-arginine deiminase family protein [gut metagenome]|uniref:Peptidyl-arginine deiminase family protein n=1 Tax=gut metagenome TaxID=749906 RepID=J9FW88_9ZZZZ